MLNDLGLPLTLPQSVTTQAGKIEIYKTRHQHYVTLHNANADVPADDTGHKTRAELLKDLAKWEKIRNTGQELDAPVIESSKQYLVGQRVVKARWSSLTFTSGVYRRNTRTSFEILCDKLVLA